jgi:hypothetical protein
MDTERRAVPVHWYNAVLVIELQHPDEPPELALTTERRVSCFVLAATRRRAQRVR